MIGFPWTPQPSSQIVYVSSSSGIDTNPGTTPDKPKKTIAAGIAMLRSGYPDHLRLRRGDVWNESLGTWKKTGAGPNSPMVIESYAYGEQLTDPYARPVLNTGAGPGFICHGASGTPTVIDGLVITGIEFRAHTRMPGSFVNTNGDNGFMLLRQARNVTIDDCKFSSYKNGIVIQDFEKKGMNDITLSNNVIVDCYDTSGKSQGVYISGVASGLRIIGNVFDHNGHGYLPGPEDDPTIFSHNLYLQHDNGLDVLVQDNIFSRAASHGCQLRSGGKFVDNFLLQNPIGFTGGYDTPVANAKLECSRNVVLEGGDIDPSLPRGWGLTFRNLVSCLVKGNIVANCKTTSPNRRSIEKFGFCTYADNIVYDWSSDPSKDFGDEWNITPGSAAAKGFRDPTRSLVDYAGPNAFEKLRAVSRLNPERITALGLTLFIEEGFAPLPEPTPDPEPEPQPEPEPTPEPNPTPELPVWEPRFRPLVEMESGEVAETQYFRTKVPSGWLLSDEVGLMYVPDPNHEWV